MDPIGRRTFLAGGAVLALVLARPLGAAEQEPSGLPFEGTEAEEFLRTARVVSREPVGEGITRPDRVTLTDGERTARALWKTIDVHKPGQQRMATGWDFDFRDSWKNEVAAYELDKLLGLGLVPPTVGRSIDGRPGSLQLWIEKAMTEDGRIRRKLQPPHLPRWNNQLHNVRLLHQLIHNTDFRNIRNVLADAKFRVYAVDNSRGFRVQKELMAPEDLQCFSRTVLEKLRALDLPLVEEKLGPWVSRMQLEGLFARRDLILALADQRVKEKDESTVLFY